MMILIIGASRGVGKALALEYSKNKHELILIARNENDLRSVNSECLKSGAISSDYYVCDVNDVNRFTILIDSLYSKHSIDKLIYVAGITSLSGVNNLENINHSQKLLQTNLSSAVAITNTIIPKMLANNHGHITYFSSLGSYYGMGYSPVYCASKAGLRVYAESIRQYCNKTNVKISLITMGFIESDMSQQFIRPKPFLINTTKAANYIYKNIQKEKAYIRFPMILQLAVRIQSILPYKLADWFMIKSGYGRK